MPIIIVEIEYDEPTYPYWMNPDNVKLCLENECKNSKFDVRWHEGGDPWGRSANDIVPPALKEKVFQTIGSASMCWEPRPGDQVFKTEEARAIGDKLCEDIQRYFDYEHYYDEPETKDILNQERNINIE